MRNVRTIRVATLLFTLLLAAAAAHAELKVASVFSDHMVLQRDQPVHVWGWAAPGEEGTVAFRGASGSFIEDSLGRWNASLPGGAAGGPFTLQIIGKNKQTTDHILLGDVLVGELWLASGQSNMEFTMGDRLNNDPAEIAAADQPLIRLLAVRKIFSDHPLEDAPAGAWQVSTPASVRTFSAVAYLFGRELNSTKKIPIGIIDASWGGTPAESWTSLDALSADPALLPVFTARATMMDQFSTTQRKQAAEQTINSERIATGAAPLDVPWRPNPDTWAPAALFNAMIAPLTSLPIRGVIWYQGESNTDPLRSHVYERLFRAMISDWRSRWHDEQMPFLFTQLANFDNHDDWPDIREAQRRTLALRNTGMVVTIDIGESNNIHPADKQDVAHRLALWARSMVYGEAIEDSGPLFSRAAPMGSQMVVTFTHAEGLHSSTGKIDGFELAGEDEHWQPAIAQVRDGQADVSSPQVEHPAYVRYGWSNVPRCSLFNAAGLPASPFTSH